MKVKIDIDTNTFVRFVSVVLVFGLGLVAVYQLRSPLTLLGISLFLALALNPPVNWIAKHLPGDSDHRVGATAAAYFMVVAAMSAALLLIVPPVVEQSSHFARSVPAFIDQVTTQRTVLNDFVETYGLQGQVDQAITNAKNQASTIAANIGGVLVNGAGSLLNGLVNLLFVLVLTFLMLVEGPTWLRRIWGLYQDPEQLERHRTLVQRMYRIVTGYVNGQMLVAAIAASASLVVILILSSVFNMPANLAVPLAVIVFISGLVPMVGATIGAALVALVLLLNSPIAALIFIIYFIVYQQIENNLISPTIQARAVEISALTILVAVLLGLSLLGILGGIIAIPVAGCIKVLINDHIEHSRKKRNVKSKNPVKLLKAKMVKE